MSPSAQPHRVIRTLLLVVSTLAVVGVLFAIYTQYFQVPAGPRRPASAPPPEVSLPRPRTQPAAPSGMEFEGVPVAQAERTRINLYTSDDAHIRLQLEFESLEPAPGGGDQYQIRGPMIRFRTPAGQLVNLRAREGVIELAKMGHDRLSLTRGQLEGGVTVLMDRLDETQRSALPPEERDHLTPERKVAIEMDDLAFDLEYARLECRGRVHAVLAEAEFEGRGLLVRYDESAGRIDFLKVRDGGRIALRALARTFKIALPGEDTITTVTSGAVAEPVAAGPPPSGVGEQRDSAARTETPAHPVAGPATAPATDTTAEADEEEEDVPLFVPEPPSKKKRRAHATLTYTAVFKNQVTVDQFEGQTRTGVLTADMLRFLFDFGQEQRDMARQLPEHRMDATTGPAVPTSGPGRDAGGAASVEEGNSEVVLHWAGTLTVDMMPEPDGVPPDTYGQRLHVVASGKEVSVADRQGGARCRELEYHRETGRVWLRGDETTDVLLDLGNGGRLSGRNVAFDPRGKTAVVTGPGTLSGERRRSEVALPAAASGDAEQGMAVRFEEEMRLCLGTLEEVRYDSLTGAPGIERRDYLESAVLDGNVVMQQHGDMLAAEHVEIGFGRPSTGDSLADHLERFHARGQVRMRQGDERITCREITVLLGPGPDGQAVPQQVEALGEVVASQGARTISARRRMLVDLQSVEVSKPPFDLLGAKLAAARQGLDVHAIDWQARREQYARKKAYTLGLRRIQASGGVRAESPEQGLHIDAGELDCAFQDGRRIDRGVVQGRDNLPANVQFSDFGITGRRIEFDASRQWAEVPDAGRMTFNSYKDLDGRPLKQPVPVAVSWAEHMVFRGRKNTAVFTGAVHAVSQTSTFDCRELTLNFTDEPGVGENASASLEGGGADGAELVSPNWMDDWWITRAWRRTPAKTARLRLEAPSLRKQLAYMTADGDVVGLTTGYNTRTGVLETRARLSGPHLGVDLRKSTEAMTIDGAGTLLLEDYRVQSARRGGDTTMARLSPFGAAGGSLPSQTFISWQGSMSFYGTTRLAAFEKGVELLYRSGSKLLLADGVLDQAALNELRQSPSGREARLLCQELTVQFARSDAAAGETGPGGLSSASGNRVAHFAAKGGVYFEDSGVSVNCRTVTFDRETQILQILGTARYPVELIDQRGGRYRSAKGPTILWDRRRDSIEAPGSTIHWQ